MVSLKVTGTCKKGLLLLFIVVLLCTKRTKQNERKGTKQNDNG